MKENLCTYKGSHGGKLFLGIELNCDSDNLGFCECYDKCQGIYLKKKSKFLKKYKRETKSKFQGCHELEKELIKNGLIKNSPMVNISTDVYREVHETEELTSVDIWEIIIQVKEGHQWNREELLALFNINKKRVKNDAASKMLIKLMRSSRYEYDPHLIFAALLIRLDMNDPAMIKKYFPGYDLKIYYTNQSKVFSDIQKRIPDKIEFIDELFEIISKPQREAVEKYYMHNDKNLSMEEVSKKLGISKSSLYSRLEGAKKRIKKFYLEDRLFK